MSGMQKYKERVEAALPNLISDSIDKEVMETLGVQVIRGAISPDKIMSWVRTWNEHLATTTDVIDTENVSNPVEFKELAPEKLYDIVYDEEILDQIEKVVGPNIGLFNKRFVLKNSSSRGGQVSLHHDTAWHVGGIDKYSIFLAFAPVNNLNGGLSFYLGTHNFGILGDAGEMNADILGPDWPCVCPELNPGDFVIMHSATWHYSVPYQTGPARFMTDFIYQNSSDPSTIETLRGKDYWGDGSFLVLNRSALWKNSRSIKLNKIREVINSSASGGIETEISNLQKDT